MNRTYKAFTLVEIMIVVAIIGIMAGIILPRMTKQKPSSKWTHILDELNSAVYFARQQAISNQQNFRLAILALRNEDHKVVVEMEVDDPEKKGQTKFIRAESEYFDPEYVLPEIVKIHAVYQGKTEILEENKGKAYCYVIPDGLVQELLIHIRRLYAGKESKMTFKVEPFFGRFTLHDGYVKPGQV